MRSIGLTTFQSTFPLVLAMDYLTKARVNERHQLHDGFSVARFRSVFIGSCITRVFPPSAILRLSIVLSLSYLNALLI
ncbi:uncharacterized protein EDB93DRAFT_361226 [Suillus bovinus]|uniref:uncharacterized protein n=1 Tax=Suillus bovinus TaxID=48563 RepID=UPI001B86793E|nr:uncharacterized protein EDB93DRAFT_361226 [Suillus bovinus]KAG2149112.1 hypothetical protein EDB93DRAFT_361226 [Suillus bovinus]